MCLTPAVFCQTRQQSHQTSFLPRASNPRTPHLHTLTSPTPPTKKNQRWVHGSDKESPAVQTLGGEHSGGGWRDASAYLLYRNQTPCTSTDRHITHIFFGLLSCSLKKSLILLAFTQKKKHKTVILDWFDCFLPLQKGQDFFFSPFWPQLSTRTRL